MQLWLDKEYLCKFSKLSDYTYIETPVASCVTSHELVGDEIDTGKKVKTGKDLYVIAHATISSLGPSCK